MLRRACLTSGVSTSMRGCGAATVVRTTSPIVISAAMPSVVVRSAVAQAGAAHSLKVATTARSASSFASQGILCGSAQRAVRSVHTPAVRYSITVPMAKTCQRRGFSTLILGSSNKGPVKQVAKSASAVTAQTSATAARSYATQMIQAEPPATQYSNVYVIMGSVAAAGLGLLVFNGLRQRAATDSLGSVAQKRIAQTYAYVASGIGLTAATATYLFMNGAARRIMAVNPWVMVGASLVSTIGSMIAITALPQENVVSRHVAFGVFNAAIAAGLSPLGFLGGQLILNAMAGTGIMVSALSLVAASAPIGSLESFEGPLGIGLGVVIASSIGQLFFPSTLLMNLVVYGGLAVFGGLMLTDTQRVIKDARDQPQFDPMVQSLSIYLNIINIFQRIVFILADRKQK